MTVAHGNPNGVLYVVATPIGNADDISARAIRILSEADLIACEDTRRTGRLLAAHSIRTPTISYFEHNESRRIPELVERLKSGQSLALVTDAGTPAISDPGYRLVHSAIDAGIRVTAVPGPSAVIAALAMAGMPTDRFAFEGFLPTKAGERHRALAELAEEKRTLVIYEAARRLPRLLSELLAEFGSDRRLAVVREATKTHEEIVRGSLAELAPHFANREVLGEVTLVIEGWHDRGEQVFSPPREYSRIVDVLREAGLSIKDASAASSKITGVSRREIYQDALRRQGETEDLVSCPVDNLTKTDVCSVILTK
jgi:16S rRNA (cytidine1402-2'-O)-methyltransferase